MGSLLDQINGKDLDIIFNEKDLAEWTVYSGKTQTSDVLVIFEDELDGINSVTGEHGITDPELIVKTADVPNITVNDTFEIRCKTYRVINPGKNYEGTRKVVLTIK